MESMICPVSPVATPCYRSLATDAERGAHRRAGALRVIGSAALDCAADGYTIVAARQPTGFEPEVELAGDALVQPYGDPRAWPTVEATVR